ncbi:MAG: amino acid permease [Alicyclobacillus macrosporangiidus]|uniref:amino acid permease n=1 Tax=Alicyclobacillus macrosporangiidus TaxID=392015 RepID=UPI0026EF830B|nr:amino acid permease [Alicyclobacillus macrosporangiidus]MCL6597975.1 amino acid permease [Alicyclobacillus macrosporangiidus]
MQAVKRRERPGWAGEQSGRSDPGLNERGLVLLGVGGIIGAGFFLGSGLPIRTAGPAVLLAFLAGAWVTSQVLGALTSIAVHHPDAGGYQSYPALYLGRFAGFLQGWTYYITSILTIASESVAMAIFARLWLPGIPQVALAALFAAVIVVINAAGAKNFTRVETLMSAVKIAALAGFILYAIAVLVPQWIQSAAGAPGTAVHPFSHGFWPTGFSGMMQSMLVVIFAYAGIGVFSAGAAQVQPPQRIDGAALRTVVLLAMLYIGSIAMLLFLIPWQRVSTTQSPFVAALSASGTPGLAGALNATILVAAFSVMAGALFSANEVLCSLAEAGDAPGWLTRRSRGGIPYRALWVSAVGIGLSLLLSFWLPASLYNVLISASSFFTFLNWFLILWTFLAWRRHTEEDNRFTSRLAWGQPVSTVITMVLLLVLTAYALLQRDQRLGFYAAAAIAIALAAAYLLAFRIRGRGRAHG